MDYDWAAIRRKEQEETKKAAEAAVTAEQPKPKPAPLAPRQEPEQAPKPKTVPLKGSVDDDMGNDENAPPSQADVDKAKAAKRARREERANRTRKIKVMEVKEVRGETQTSKQCAAFLAVYSLLTPDSSSKSRFSRKTKDTEKEGWPRTDDDPAHQGSYG